MTDGPLNYLDGLYERVKAASNARAATLAGEGRSQQRFNLWHRSDLTREQHHAECFRWAFWRQTRRMATQADRDATDDAFFVDLLEYCMRLARTDERERIGRALVSGLQTMLGDEATGLVRDVADEMGLLHE